MRRKIAARTMAPFLLLAVFCNGQSNGSPSDILKEASPVRMRSILQGMGFKFTEESNNGANSFHFQLDGYNITLFDQTSDLQLYTGSPGKVDVERVNEWNRNYRFGRAYVNENGNPVLEADLNLKGGVTREAVEIFIMQFETTLHSYGQILAFGQSPGAQSNAAAEHRKSASATRKISTPFGDFALWVDQTKWKQTATDGVGQLQFENVNGEGYAKVFTERIGIPTDSLGELAFSNARKVDPNAKITLREKRIVNGRQVLAMQIDGTNKSILFRLYGYYYGGASGSIQLVTYTASSAFDQNVTEFTRFLDGLEISDQELTSR